MPRSSRSSHPRRDQLGTIYQLPPHLPQPPSHSRLSGPQAQGRIRPQGHVFYPARGEGGGWAREAEQIYSARHLLPALQKNADGASFESVAFSA